MGKEKEGTNNPVRAILGFSAQISQALKNAPKLACNSYRGLTFNTKDEMEKYMLDIKQGNVCCDRGFLSTTYKPSVVYKGFYEKDSKFNVLFELQGVNGSLIESISNFPEEHEVLFDRSSRWEVVNLFRDKNGNAVIRMRELSAK